MGPLLVTPPAANEPERLPRIALGYLCAHLGEGLAQGRIPSPEALTIGDGVDTHHLRACLAHPLLARLPAALQSPELQAAVRQMLGEPPRRWRAPGWRGRKQRSGHRSRSP